MKSSWHSLIPFLPFPAAANSGDSTQFSSEYCSIHPATLLLLLLSFRTLVITTLHGTNGKNCFLLSRMRVCCNRRPIAPLVCFCGNVFNEPLPSNGYARHNMLPHARKSHCCRTLTYRGTATIFWSADEAPVGTERRINCLLCRNS
jgi:hypothetical protein